ncbi:hypothetical protein L1987_02958 [Smallanthus sonchifolius]|uniref:Uncharacterized protein n=1 Tax=Smallanthus sonchifolius TaxID=185202 RepID=A0ACB9K9E7_9ASTR|nr:hypothetical protein L1987_02958 [Smallanthus sonchifolius]
MAGPFYNMKANLVMAVPNGECRFEMACPYLSEQATCGGEINPCYEKVCESETSIIGRGERWVYLQYFGLEKGLIVVEGIETICFGSWRRRPPNQRGGLCLLAFPVRDASLFVITALKMFSGIREDGALSSTL